MSSAKDLHDVDGKLLSRIKRIYVDSQAGFIVKCG